MRFLKIVFFSAAVIGLMAGSAFAGTVRVNHGAANTSYTISLEALGAARSILLQGTGGIGGANAAGNYAIEYAPGQNLTATNLVNLTFNGAAFNGSTINVCSSGTNQILATATPAAGANTANFQLAAGTNVLTTQFVYLTNGNCNSTAAADGSNNLPIQIPITASATTATVTVGAQTAGGISIDTVSTANIARVRAEYASAFANPAAAHIVDYLGTPGNGTTFTVTPTGATNLTANSLAAANINRTVNNFNANFGGAQNAGLTVGSVVSLGDTQAWQGLTKVFINTIAAGNCTDSAGSNTVGTGAPTGTVALTVPAASFNGAGNIDLSLCLVGGGNALSIPRTITASVNVDVTGTGANDPAASTFTTVDTWTTNAYQGFVGWLVNSTVVPTFCLISNNDTIKTVTVLMDVVSSEGSTVVSGTLGTIAPKTAKLATFTSGSVTLAGASPVSIATVPADNRYSSKLTITTAPANASVTCIQTDPATGVKRAVPTFSNSPNLY